MDKLHQYRAWIAEAINTIRVGVRQAKINAPDDIDQRQAAVLLTKLEEVEDRARRMLGEPASSGVPSEPTHGYDLASHPPDHAGVHWALRAEDQGHKAGQWVPVTVLHDSVEWLGIEKPIGHPRFTRWDHVTLAPPR